MISVSDSKGGATFGVRVQPRARRNAVVGELEGALKLALTAPPVEGRANQACTDFLAELLGLPRSSVSIVAGETSRNKVVQISGLSASDVRERLKERNL